MKDYSIAGIGEVLWDLFPEYKRLGGGTANFAYHVSQFGFDAAVASALVHEPLGDEVEICLSAGRALLIRSQRV